MKFLPTENDPEVSIWNPVLPKIDRTEPVSGQFKVHICCYFVIISFIH